MKASPSQYIPTENALPSRFDKSEWHHEQLERRRDLAIYRRWKESSPESHYEVIRIIQNPEREICGRKYPPMESYPGSAQWGVNGWTFKCLNLAKAKFSELLNVPRKIKKL